jgi:hypothetical protein
MKHIIRPDVISGAELSLVDIMIPLSFSCCLSSYVRPDSIGRLEEGNILITILLLGI